jgi:hypothetical protein
MTDTHDSTPYGAGSHGHEFPEIDPAVRQTIAERFNADNRFFHRTLGFRVVDIRRGYARLTVENRMALMQPAGLMHGGCRAGWKPVPATTCSALPTLRRTAAGT